MHRPAHRLFALIDCNNFFVSCERIFRPDLKDRPVVVLSNNDGCIIARSEEAKKLGIRMGTPYYTVKDKLAYKNLVVFSGNFPLYSDISSRVMDTLDMLCGHVEVYSVDEAFMDYSDATFPGCGFRTPGELGAHINDTVSEWIGVPVSVGMAPTRTLAKIGAQAAKRKGSKALDLTIPEERDALLGELPVGDIWGIGRRLAPPLKSAGITTAAHLAAMNRNAARKRGGVLLERIVLELRGVSCRDLKPPEEPQKQMMHSRTFGRAITEFKDLREAICHFAEEVCVHLRSHNQYAGAVSVLITTGPYHAHEKIYSNCSTTLVPELTNDSRKIRAIAVRLAEQMWRDGYRYKRAGVILGDLTQSPLYQPQLEHLVAPKLDEEEGASSEKTRKVMPLVDLLNAKGEKRVWFASEGIGRRRPRRDPGQDTDLPVRNGPRWKINRQLLSPSYTTDWSQLPTVK